MCVCLFYTHIFVYSNIKAILMNYHVYKKIAVTWRTGLYVCVYMCMYVWCGYIVLKITQ